MFPMKDFDEVVDVILLDIDDCLYPNANLWCGRSDPMDDVKIAEINFKRLKLVCEQWNLKIIIISSMSTHLIMHEGKVYYNMDGYIAPDEPIVADLMRKYLTGHIIGLSCGNKEQDIKDAIQSKKYGKVLVIEDSDFSHNVNPNNGSYWLETRGYLTGATIGRIKLIMEGENAFTK